MEGLNPQIPRAFGLDVGNLRKERLGYLCRTDKKAYLVQKTELSPERLAFIHYLKEALFAAGFTDTDRYCLTAEGLPYAGAWPELYTAVRYEVVKEARFDDREQILDVIQAVGRMHAAAAKNEILGKYPGKIPAPPRENGLLLSEASYEECARNLRGYKKTVLKQGRMSDFDVLFLKRFDSFMKQLTRSMEVYSRPEVREILRTRGRAFAHNGLKEDTVGYHGDGLRVTGFGGSSEDTFLYDVASIIKRHMRGEGPLAPLEELLTVYGEENPLSDGELKALYAILLVPDKFYKICEKYYSKRRTWTPASFNGVMEDIARKSDILDEHVTRFFDAM